MLRPYSALRRKLGYLDRHQLTMVHDAYRLAANAHGGQRRQTGEPYISHPVAVAMILADFRMDHESVMAALLHDVLEDTAVEKTEIFERFGQSVADLVDGVTKLARINFKDRDQANAESLRKMMMAMSNDMRVILIKLADRLHNLRTIAICSQEKRARVAKETLSIYAPIAYRMGMHELSQELNALGLSAWYPKRYAVLESAVKKARGNRKEIMAVIMKSLKEALQKSAIKSFEMTGREKNIYSIYKKMTSKQLSFSEIMDVYGFRLLVDHQDDCYRALGVVHSVYRPRAHRFKDYIAIPKVNGYQSIHTGLYGPFGVPIEIQIRTHKMEELATSGIAAHWLYKTGETVHDLSCNRVAPWLKSVLAMQLETGKPEEFIENVKLDLFPKEVYVFTPKGRVMELPVGSSVVDFAYAVHTDIGNHCVAAKMGRRLMPLSTVLQNSQTIEIVTSKKAGPDPLWLNFAVTSKAKSGIRQALKAMKMSETIAIGRRLLTKACMAFSMDLRNINEDVLASICAECKVDDMDALCLSIGLGNRNANMVANRISMTMHDHSESNDHGAAKHDAGGQLIIQGSEGQAVQFAGCCSPIPGDSAVAMIQPGRGIEVHRETCKFLQRADTKRRHLAPVQWAADIDREFTVRVHVLVEDLPGALAQVTSAIASASASILDVVMRRKEKKYANFLLTLSVKDVLQFENMERALKKSKFVARVVRHMKSVD